MRDSWSTQTNHWSHRLPRQCPHLNQVTEAPIVSRSQGFTWRYARISKKLADRHGFETPEVNLNNFKGNSGTTVDSVLRYEIWGLRHSELSSKTDPLHLVRFLSHSVSWIFPYIYLLSFLALSTLDSHFSSLPLDPQSNKSVGQGGHKQKSARCVVTDHKFFGCLLRATNWYECLLSRSFPARTFVFEKGVSIGPLIRFWIGPARVPMLIAAATSQFFKAYNTWMTRRRTGEYCRDTDAIGDVDDLWSGNVPECQLSPTTAKLAPTIPTPGKDTFRNRSV